MRSFTALLIFVLLLGMAEAEPLNYGLGPIELEDQFPLNLLHSTLVPSTPKVLEQGEIQVSSDFLWSNTFATKRSGHYIVDAETRVWRNSLKVGIVDQLELEVRIPLIYRGGGNLDSFIDAWHRAFGFNRGKRPDAPTDRYLIAGSNSDGSELYVPDQGTAVGDLNLGVKYELARGDSSRPAVSLIAETRLPTASRNAFGQESIDLLAGVLASKGWGNFYLYSGLSYLRLFDDEISGAHFASDQLHGFLQGEYDFTPRIAALLGVLGESETVADLETFPNYAFYLDAGIKCGIGDATQLHLLLRENLADLDATTDVTILLGAEYRFHL